MKITLIQNFFLFQPNDPVMIQPTVPEDKVTTMFPLCANVSLPSGRKYLRKTPHPQ